MGHLSTRAHTCRTGPGPSGTRPQPMDTNATPFKGFLDMLYFRNSLLIFWSWHWTSGWSNPSRNYSWAPWDVVWFPSTWTRSGRRELRIISSTWTRGKLGAIPSTWFQSEPRVIGLGMFVSSVSFSRVLQNYCFGPIKADMWMCRVVAK